MIVSVSRRSGRRRWRPGSAANGGQGSLERGQSEKALIHRQLFEGVEVSPPSRGPLFVDVEGFPFIRGGFAGSFVSLQVRGKTGSAAAAATATCRSGQRKCRVEWRFGYRAQIDTQTLETGEGGYECHGRLHAIFGMGGFER